jgi:cytochrome c oxidase subunit II
MSDVRKGDRDIGLWTSDVGHFWSSIVSDKWWSVLFGAVMIACGAIFVVAPASGWWMPDGVSYHAWDVDFLFYLILAITGFFFILTEALLVYFMYRYAAVAPGEVRGPSRWWQVFKPLSNVFNTSYKIEMAWTVVPAVILVYIAFAQVNTWAEVKYKSRLQTALQSESKVGQPVQVDLSARQFEWRFRYPSPDTWRMWKKNAELAQAWVRTPNFDDVYVPNELHCVKDRHVVIQLSTKDVIHSFNIPQMRVKQDALPGKIIPVWFKPIAANVTKVPLTDGKFQWEDGGGHDSENGKPFEPAKVWQIACAELCGWGHYRMIGRTYVHNDEADFLEWLESAAIRQNNFGK